VTRRLKDAGELMGVRVLDHIIIGDGSFVSFVARGIL
jgi:DNA repair protein RadC